MTSEYEPDIPDFLEIKGEKIPIDEEDYRNFLLEAGKRVLAFTQMEPIQIKLEEKVIVEFDMKPFVKIGPDGEGTIIHIDQLGIKIKNGLIGLGGYYYIPQLVGARDVNEVINAWNWLFSKSNIPKEEFETLIEGIGVMELITSGKEQGLIFRVMGLAIDLKKLDETGVDISGKISELANKVKGNLRSFNKNRDEQKGLGAFNIMQLKRQLSDMSAESVLAWFAKKQGMDIKLAKSPDILIDGVRVEVKSDRLDHMDESGFENKLTKGLEQGGDLVAIFTGFFDKKSIKNFKIAWLPVYKLEESLKIAILTCKNNTKCVLLFSGSTKGFFGRVGIIRHYNIKSK